MGLLKNSTIVVFGIVISNLLAYVFHIYAGRALGPEEYGVFGALLALFTILNIPNGAINSAMSKYVSKLNSKKEFRKIGGLRNKTTKTLFVYFAFVFLVLIILSRFVADYLKIESVWLIFIVLIIIVFSMLVSISRGVVQGMGKFKVYSLSTIIESGSRLVLLLIILFFGFKSGGTLLAYGLANLVAFMFILPYIKETKVNGDETEAKGFFNFVILALIVSLFMQMLINLPTILIKHYATSHFTGLWTAALNLARVSLFIASGISLVMFSTVSGTSDKKKKRSVFIKSMLLTILASSGIALAFFLFPHLFITMLYGEEFIGAIPILEWLGLAMIFVAIIQLWLNYLLAGKE